MELVERLKESQGRRSQRRFARELGISQPHLSRIYSSARHGRARIGMKVAQRIVARYPHLALEIAAFLLSPHIFHESKPSSSEILPGAEGSPGHPSAQSVPGEGGE